MPTGPSQADDDNMAEHVFVPDIAREFGVKIADVLRTAERLSLPIRRGAARLTSLQAQQLRQAYKDGAPRQRFVPPPPPQPRFERLRTSRCLCCDLSFKQKESEADLHCELCADHYEIAGEDASRTIARLVAHIELFRGRYEQVATKATSYENRMKSALASRDKWRKMLVEVMLGHEPEKSGCCCGAPVLPCGTRRQVEMSNRGIYRQIEQFEGMHHDELLELMYGDQYTLPNWDWLEARHTAGLRP